MESKYLYKREYTHSIFGKDARDKIVEGAIELRNIVQVTMSPNGRYVGYSSLNIQDYQLTNDGVSVLSNIVPKCKFANFGSIAVKEASQKTAHKFGDWTTGSAVVCANVIIEGAKLINDGKNPVILREEWLAEKDKIVNEIKKNAKKISEDNQLAELEKVAITSAKSETIGKIAAGIYNEIGDYGTISFEPNLDANKDHSFKVKPGYLFMSKIADQFCFNKKTMNTFWENPAVVFVNENINQNLPSIFMTKLAYKVGKRNIIIVANSWDKKAQEQIHKFNEKREYKIIPLMIFAPTESEKTETIQDFKAFIGGDKDMITIDSENEYNNFNKEMDDKYIYNVDAYTYENGINNFVIKEKGEACKTRINYLQTQYKKELNARTETMELKLLSNRIAGLQRGAATMYVTCSSEAEFTDIRDSLDDAIKTCRSAMNGGIVAGGGIALRNVAIALGYKKGTPLYDILCYNEMIIRKNSGVEDTKEIKNKEIGYNTLTRKKENLIESGILDPAASIIGGFENAISSAVNILLTEILQININEYEYDKK